MSKDNQANSLKVAILTEVSRQGSITGYSLSKSIPDSANWNASHQQIYRDCNNLEKQGLMSVTYLENDGKPDARLYSITDAGKEVLEDIRGNAEFKRPTFKNPLTVMLLAGSSSYFEAAISSLQNTIDSVTEALQELKEAPESAVKRLSLELELDSASTELKFAYKAQKLLCE